MKNIFAFVLLLSSVLWSFSHFEELAAKYALAEIPTLESVKEIPSHTLTCSLFTKDDGPFAVQVKFQIEGQSVRNLLDKGPENDGVGHFAVSTFQITKKGLAAEYTLNKTTFKVVFRMVHETMLHSVTKTPLSTRLVGWMSDSVGTEAYMACSFPASIPAK